MAKRAKLRTWEEFALDEAFEAYGIRDIMHQMVSGHVWMLYVLTIGLVLAFCLAGLYARMLIKRRCLDEVGAGFAGCPSDVGREDFRWRLPGKTLPQAARRPLPRLCRAPPIRLRVVS